MNSENHFLLQQFINYPSSKIKCLAFHTKLCRKQSTLLERLPLQMKRPPHLSVYVCIFMTVQNNDDWKYWYAPVLKEQTCIPCHTSLRPYTITRTCKQFTYCTSLSQIFLYVLTIHNWYFFNFLVALCINNIKHFIVQLMHRNYKIRLLK